MTGQFGILQIALGAGVILLAFLYRRRSNPAKFRWLFLLGLMGLISGLIAAGLIHAWIAIGLFVSWFAAAVYFYCVERRESGRAE